MSLTLQALSTPRCYFICNTLSFNFTLSSPLLMGIPTMFSALHFLPLVFIDLIAPV